MKEELVVEVGMKLDKSLIYYHDMLINNGLRLDYSCITRDIYYTKDNLDGLTENQMKNACIRVRYCNSINEKTKIINKRKKKKIKAEQLKKEQELIKQGYKKIFDTIKFDFQYCNKDMKSKVQLQDIKDIGLLVYYDNPNYYGYSLDEQRKMLFDELNLYGFSFKETDLGLDKLRTLYYGKEMYSKNQNG